MKKIFFRWIVYAWVLLIGLPVVGQQLITLEGRPGISFRGLSVVNDEVVWVSGSRGTVGLSLDGGRSFSWQQVKGYETRDFRDIEAFDAGTAMILAVDSPGIILRTEDGGKNWREVYRDDRSGIFLDAMSFYDRQEGVVIGDPIDGNFVVLRTADGGRSWQPGRFQVSNTVKPAVSAPAQGEAFFAASGTNIQCIPGGQALFVSGGSRSRVFINSTPINLPLVQGGTSTGANSLAIRSLRDKTGSNHWVIVGGDFSRDTARTGNIAITRDGGRNWLTPVVPPFGYRSCAVFVGGEKLVSCGTSGVDVSDDGGLRWRNISTTGYHVVQKAKTGRTVYLAGGNGRLAKLTGF